MDLKETQKLYENIREKRSRVYHISLTEQQKSFSEDIPAKGGLWVSRLQIPGAGEHGTVAAIQEAITLLDDGTQSYSKPLSADVDAEWVGPRAGVERSAPEPKIPEVEKYKLMMEEVSSDLVMLYAHGGAGLVGSSASSRALTSKLATLTKGRVLSINYRLAPRYPFPSQVIDLLLAYLYLLYPPPGSLHVAIPASQIVFVGDSFGGTLSLSLIQAILALNGNPAPDSITKTVIFGGKPVILPLPAGVALVSAYGYNPYPFPSWTKNKLHDTFPLLEFPHCNTTYFPACSIWPASPPRGDVYCETSMLSHPLVCPSTASSWKGSPPLYLGNGQERCVDTAAIIARQAARDGVVVRWEVYEGMCHIFMTIFSRWRQSVMIYNHWSEFANMCVESPHKLTTTGSVFAIEDLNEEKVDVENLTELTWSDARNLQIACIRERNVWTGPTEKRKAML